MRKHRPTNPMQAAGGIVERIVPGTEVWEKEFHLHLHRYRFALPYIKGKRVLDVACGSGYFSRYLFEEGAGGVVGVDISEETIGFAEEHFLDPHISFRKMDAHEVSSIGEMFDTVVSVETIEHLIRPERFLQEIKRILKPAGYLVISTPNAIASVGKNPYHVKEFTYQEFRDLLEQYFSIEKFYGNTFQDIRKDRVHPFHKIAARIFSRKLKNLIPLDVRIKLSDRLNKGKLNATPRDMSTVKEVGELPYADEFIVVCRNTEPLR